MNRLIVFVVLLAAACERTERAVPRAADSTSGQASSECVNEWMRVASGVEYRTLNCTPAGFDLHLVRVDPTAARVDTVLRSGTSAAELGRKYRFAINANFFDEDFRPLGVVVSSAKQMNGPHPVSWQSVFFVDKEGSAGIVPVGEWDRVRDRGIVAAVQCGPRLVVDGEKNEVARGEPTWRSGVCIDPGKRVTFFATSPEKQFDVHEMVDLAAGPMGCRDAMLFDGGPSTQMYLRRNGSEVVVEGDEQVPAYVVVR